jgi:superfamily II DNA/RNA helicase
MNSKVIKYLIDKFDSKCCLVFVNKKIDAKILTSKLRNENLRCAELHGDVSQTTRTRVMAQFRQSRLNVIIATDVAARGIDIPDINLVIQVDLPANGIDYYIHRTGRTGRGGRPGTSVVIDNGLLNNSVLRLIRRLTKINHLELPQEIKDQKTNYKDDDDDDYDMDSYQERKSYNNNRNNGYDRPRTPRFNEDRQGTPRYNEDRPRMNRYNSYDQPKTNRYNDTRSKRNLNDDENDFF